MLKAQAARKARARRPVQAIGQYADKTGVVPQIQGAPTRCRRSPAGLKARQLAARGRKVQTMNAAIHSA